MTRRPASVRTRAVQALAQRLLAARPGLALEAGGYAPSPEDTLLPGLAEAAEVEFRGGSGDEWRRKIRAPHSSSALAANVFLPFRVFDRLSELHLPGLGAGFGTLRLEGRVPSGLSRANAPNLDVLLTGERLAVGVESKLIEPLSPHAARFSPRYRDEAVGAWRDGPWFHEMLRLMKAADAYRHLDAAQLVKHAFGLANTFPDARPMLVYLFWEPADPACDPAFTRHRDEVADFAGRVAGGTPGFVALSYPELWTAWRSESPSPWLSAHLNALEARYSARLGD